MKLNFGNAVPKKPVVSLPKRKGPVSHIVTTKPSANPPVHVVHSSRPTAAKTAKGK